MILSVDMETLRHCYCTPCSICKREKFDQFNTSLNYVYKYPPQYDIVSMAKRFHIGFYAKKKKKNVMKCICAAYLDSRKKHFEPSHDKTNKMTFVHPPSLIRVFAVRSMGSLGPSFASGGQRRLIRLGGCSCWSESSLGAQIILLVLSCRGSIFILKAPQKPLRMAL